MQIKNNENIILTAASERVLRKLSTARSREKLYKEKGGVIIGTRHTSSIISITGRFTHTDDYTSSVNLKNYSSRPDIYVSNDNIIVWYTENLLRSKKILAYYHYHLSANPHPSQSDIRQMEKNVLTLKRDLLMFIFAENGNVSVRNFRYRDQ